MKENNNNKSLVRLNDNIFSRLRNWFISFFNFKTNNNDENHETLYKSIEKSEPNAKTDFLNSLKPTENDDTKIFDLQRKYENGNLTVSDMTKEEYSKIEELYNKQIENLQNQIRIKKEKLSTN